MGITIPMIVATETKFDFVEPDGRWYDLPLAAIMTGGNGMAFAIWAAVVVSSFSVHWILGTALAVITILGCLILISLEIDDSMKRPSRTQHFALLWKETGVIHKSGLENVQTRPQRFSKYSILEYNPVFKDSLQVNAGPEMTIKASVYLTVTLPVGDSERLSTFIKHPAKTRKDLVAGTFIQAVANHGIIGTSGAAKQLLKQAVEREMLTFLPAGTLVSVDLGYYQVR